MSSILCATIRYSLAGGKHHIRALPHSCGDPCPRHCFHKSWSYFCLCLHTYLIVPIHSFSLTTHTIACSVLCSNTCVHICRSYCLELSPESRWSPAVSLCALVSSIFPELNCDCSRWVSRGRQEAGRDALSNRAEKQHCQCRTQPFPTKNCCTSPKHGVRHSILLKEQV